MWLQRFDQNQTCRYVGRFQSIYVKATNTISNDQSTDEINRKIHAQYYKYCCVYRETICLIRARWKFEISYRIIYLLTLAYFKTKQDNCYSNYSRNMSGDINRQMLRQRIIFHYNIYLSCSSYLCHL